MKAFPSTLSSAFGIINNWKMPLSSLQRSLSMRVMGLHLPTLMKTRKTNKRKPSILLPQLNASNVKERVIICTHVQKNKITLRCCLMGKKLKTAWMKTSLHLHCGSTLQTIKLKCEQKFDLA